MKRCRSVLCATVPAAWARFLAAAAIGSLLNLPLVSSAADRQDTGTTDPVVRYIDEAVARGWEQNGVEPSSPALDSELLRRAYLDIVGHIPPADVAERFLRDRDKKKRATLVDELLRHDDYAANWTTVWSNILLGRETPRRVSRDGLNRWLRSSFASNKPYNEFVRELITARGHFEQNGATNFLLANLNDEATPAAAKVSRIFLGVQLQCTQCHNHPFNEWTQQQFWQFNSFFRQTRARNHYGGDGMFDYAELVDDQLDPTVFFERRDGLMQVAFPTFLDGTKIDTSPTVSRRDELAAMMVDPSRPWLARAIVNRMWAHFFGYGFTRPAHEMGPHNPPSHPELLGRLADEFVASGYDLKQLIRWIANSRAYGLSSRFGGKNRKDDPDKGETPLFSRMYVRQMSAEQLYDSLIVATEAHWVNQSSGEEAERQRREWLGQFVIAFGTDENDEATTFDGTIPQALMMMNGPLIQRATSGESGGYLARVLREETSAVDAVERLYFAALGRAPSRAELAVARRIVEASGTDTIAALQDLFWALLNSNEFILIH